MDLDSLFVSRLLQSSSDEFREASKKIQPNLIGGTEKDIYVFIRNYFRESKGIVPSILAIRKKFPDFKPIKAEDSIQFYCSELKDRAEYELMTKANTLVQNKLFNKDLTGAKDELKKLFQSLGESSFSEASTMKSLYVENIQDYIKARKLDGHIGLQTGISGLDNHIGGITDEMIVIMGKVAVGKTFLLLIIANGLWKQLQVPIVVVSNELSLKKMSGRMASIEGHFSYSKFKRGTLTKKEENKIKSVKEIVKGRPDIYFINGNGKDVNDIEFEIMAIQPKPGLLLVDGFYLTNMHVKDDFGNVRAASRAYRELKSRLGIPLIGTTQMTEGFEAKYAKALGEDADIVMYLWRSPQMKDMNRMGVNFTKIRDEDDELKLQFNWDFEHFIFDEITGEEPPDESSEQSYD
jgi:replicative DNA helicase